MLLAAVAAALLAGCTSNGYPDVAEVTIPVETVAVATTAPTTAAVTTPITVGPAAPAGATAPGAPVIGTATAGNAPQAIVEQMLTKHVQQMIAALDTALRELKNARPDSPDFDGNLRQSFQR